MNKYLLVLAAAAAAVILLGGDLDPSAVSPGQRIRLADGSAWVVVGRHPHYPRLWEVHAVGDAGWAFAVDEEDLRAAGRGEYPPLPGQGTLARNGRDCPSAYRRQPMANAVPDTPKLLPAEASSAGPDSPVCS